MNSPSCRMVSSLLLELTINLLSASGRNRRLRATPLGQTARTGTPRACVERARPRERLGGLARPGAASEPADQIVQRRAHGHVVIDERGPREGEYPRVRRASIT